MMDEVHSLQQALPNVVMNGLHTEMQNGIHFNVHVEVLQKKFSTFKVNVIKEHVERCLSHSQLQVCLDGIITQFTDAFLQENIESIQISDFKQISLNKNGLDLSNTTFHIHVFRLHDDGPAQEDLEGDEELSAATHWLLPATEFHGLWDSLIFDSDIKSQLLQYASTTLLFSDRNVDSNIISWNRVILLHGPPGTGKTSLCKALAQKLCIQLSGRYSYGQLIEINSHSLFSKWFSESGKLVMKMFQKIQEMIDDKDALVCVLMDEVESLTAARKAALNGSEPSDAIRVVNALLTQLDQIKKNSNVMILTTSNITGAIDLAFVDRADIKQYIGPPSPAAIYTIYTSCLRELMKAKIIFPKESIMDLSDLEVMSSTNSLRLRDIARKSEGLSGRTLRKLPFVAHALYIHKPNVSLVQFLEALEAAVIKQFQEREDLCNS